MIMYMNECDKNIYIFVLIDGKVILYIFNYNIHIPVCNALVFLWVFTI